MRPVAIAFLLASLAFAGCIGGGFDETSTTDRFGNTYTVFASQGEPPEDGEVVVGASARDLLSLAEALAEDWSDEANLFTVIGIETAEGASEGVFAGPSPQAYDLYDAQPGDGQAPAWNYLFLSPEKVTDDQCQFLFVHVAHNGFAVSYTFDPGSADFGGDDRAELWVCDEHTPAESRADWTVDSDEAAAAIAAADDRYGPAAEGADSVVWGLLVHYDADPEDEVSFDTMWLAGVLDSGGAPEDTLTCFTAASDAATETECFDQDGQGTGDDGDDGMAETSDPVAPESGEGTVSFGFVFSGDQEDSFSIQDADHPSLRVDYTVAANQPSGTYTVELLDVNGTAIASIEHGGGSAASGTLGADDPVAGEWTVRVSGSAGTPEVEFTWCALGYDYANETAIDCA